MATRKAAIVHLTQKDGYLWLTAPYNPEANARYKELGAKWVPDSKLWRFDPLDTDVVLALIQDLFGCDIRVGETGVATKGTEYLGKGGFGKRKVIADMGLVSEAPGEEQSTFQKAQFIAASLSVHMMALTEQQKEEIFKIAFGDE